MSVISTIKNWFQSAALSKDDQQHQAKKGDKPPTDKGGDKGGIGATKTTVQDAKKTEQDWKGDT